MNRPSRLILPVALALACLPAAAAQPGLPVPAAGTVEAGVAPDSPASAVHPTGMAGALAGHMTDEELERFGKAAPLILKYASRYGFDWLLIVAQAYQESRFDQGAVSNKGAVGIMQVLPSTAADSNVDIPDISIVENNIHAGSKYLRFVRDRYYGPEPMSELDKTLFALASYNAGPARVSELRAEAASRKLDPNLWFGNVERIAARRIGRETVDYVGNIHRAWTRLRSNFERRARPAAAHLASRLPANREPVRLNPLACRVEDGGHVHCEPI